MTTTLNIPARAFQAALLHAGKSDVRYYLNGVYLDFPKGRIVATTGHTMFIGKIDTADCPPVIVPRELIESALKSMTKKARETFDIAVTIADTNGVISAELAVAGGMFRSGVIDGRFPEYERVVPLSCDDEYAQFNPEYLFDANLALRTYANTSEREIYNLQRNGLSAGLMTGPNCLVVIMPFRHGPDLDMEWYTGKPAAPECACHPDRATNEHLHGCPLYKAEAA